MLTRLQGGFAALMAPAALSILTITFQHDAKERAQAFGAYGAVSGAGGAIGVLLGGVLTEYVSWRWAFYVNAPLGILAAVVLYRTFPFVPPHASSRRIDWLGLVTLTGWMANTNPSPPTSEVQS